MSQKALSTELKEERGGNNRLPKPSESFIQKYIESYNAGKPIVDVMVEYEYPEILKVSKHLLLTGSDEEKEERDAQVILKVNPKDNTITIKKVKDNFSREEVKTLLEKYHKAWENRSVYDNDEDPPILNEWIKKNL